MKRKLRILVLVLGTISAIAFAVLFVAPVALVFYNAHDAAQRFPAVANVPVDLKDFSVSPAPGRKLSYLGLEFEVPWSDLGEEKTKVTNGRVVLCFKSGVVVSVASAPARSYLRTFQAGGRLTPEYIAALWGREAAESDYGLTKAIYSITPQKIYRFSLSTSSYYRDSLLLTLKTITLPRGADSGIFNVRSKGFRGFQIGDPQRRPLQVEINLYSDSNDVGLLVLQSKSENPVEVSQSDINRIVQSLRYAEPQVLPAIPIGTGRAARTSK